MGKRPLKSRGPGVAVAAGLVVLMTVGSGCNEVAKRRRRKRPPEPVPMLPDDADPSLYAFVEAPYGGERLQTRPIMIYAESPGHPDALEQLAILGSDLGALAEREVIIVQVYGSGVSRYRGQPMAPSSAKSWHDRYRAGRWPFEVVLVGKDGGVKLRRPRVVEMEELLEVIEALPVRREEVYQREHLGEGVGGAAGGGPGG